MDSELFQKFSGLTVTGTVAAGVQFLRDIIIAAGDRPQRWMFAFEQLFRYTEDFRYLPQFGESTGFYPPHALIDLSRFKGFNKSCYKCYLQGTDFNGKDIQRDRNFNNENVSVIRYRQSNAKVCSHYYKCPHFKRALELSDMSQFSETEKKLLEFYMNARWEIVVTLDILITLIEMSMEIDVDHLYTKFIFEIVEIAEIVGVDKLKMLQYESQYLKGEVNEDVFGRPINCRDVLFTKKGMNLIEY